MAGTKTSGAVIAQLAGAVAREAGLADGSGFCPVEAGTQRSVLDKAIFVLGDASIAGDLPKSGFAASGHGKVAAMVIHSELLGLPLFEARYTNTCWSQIAPEDAVKVGGVYGPRDGRIVGLETFVSQPDENVLQRKAQSAENLSWYDAFCVDIFT